jgi:nickel transport protein
MLCGLCVTWALLALPDAARAHRVYLFAWDEDGRVCSESYYSKTARIADAELAVRDADGKELLRGRSDSDGRFCFSRPSVAELVLSVDAGQGHRGEFRLSAKIPASPALSEKDAQADSARLAAAPSDHEESLRRIVREELARILPPLPAQQQQMPLRSGREEEPGPREIVGGLGWIAGLAALFAWYRRRRAS